MTGATHLAAAAAIYRHGKWDGSPPVLLTLAFFSHFLLDAAPHYELSLAWNYYLALPVAAWLVLAARRERDVLLLAAACLGILPDTNWLLDLSPTLTKIHSLFHYRKAFGPVPVFFLLAEFAVAAVCLYCLPPPLWNAPGDRGGRRRAGKPPGG